MATLPVAARPSAEQITTPLSISDGSYREGPPVCALCRLEPASKLPITGRLGNIVVYCSLYCAAIAGLERALDSDLVMCMECNDWTDLDGVCQRCDAGEPVNDPDSTVYLTLPMNAAIGGGK